MYIGYSSFLNTKRSNSISLTDNPEVKDLIKIPYVKELLVKLDVLKNGIINERQKNKENESQIKQLESELNSKASQIKDLTEAKSDLEKQLEIEKKKLAKKEEGFLRMASLLNSSSQNSGKFCVNPSKSLENGEEIDENEKKIEKKKSEKELPSITNEEMLKLKEEITRLKFENETIILKLNKSLEEYENKKLEFKTLIKEQKDKIKSLEEEIIKKDKEKQDLEEKLKLNLTKYQEFSKEREHYDILIKDYKKSRDEAIHQMNACLEKCGKLTEENQEYKDNIALHQSDAVKMAEKLAEYKNMLIKINLRNQMFHVIKVGLLSNIDIDIYFGQDKDGNYVMRIDEKDNVELINILDVDYIKQVDKNNKNKVQISYMSKSKRIRTNVIVDDYVIEQFIEAYRNFYSESVKVQNKIAY
jgi:DNA repair exonuclease SbcCD ATPase subunit